MSRRAQEYRFRVALLDQFAKVMNAALWATRAAC
jgi:hypothetical protein